MRQLLALAAAAAIGTAANAVNVSFAFPTANSIYHTANYDGTLGNGQNFGAFTAGDYVQTTLPLPELSFSSFTFTAPLINNGLTTNLTANILLNNDFIGSFLITPTNAQNGFVSGGGDFALRTVSGVTTLRVELANSAPAGRGSITPGFNGVFNLAVPEPGTWATMTVGFGLVGWSIRRRRRDERRLAA